MIYTKDFFREPLRGHLIINVTQNEILIVLSDNIFSISLQTRQGRRHEVVPDQI
jgi:hypothetical protein